MGERSSEPGAAPEDVTRILNRLGNGAGAAESSVEAELVEHVIRELRVIASAQLAGERSAHTLQATALVHEAYLRLLSGQEYEWKTRGHFYSAAAEAIRRVLIEHARRRGALKRGGAWQRIPLEGLSLLDAEDDEKMGGFLALDHALERLSEVDARAARIVRLRFFAGLEAEDVAAVMGISRRTLMRDWAWARAWLAKELAAR